MKFTQQDLNDKLASNPALAKRNADLAQPNQAGGVAASHAAITVTLHQPPGTSAPRQPSIYKNETDLQNQIANYLRQWDIWFSRQRMDRKSTTTLGTPDFLCAIMGHPVAIEAKIPGNDLTEDQAQVRLKMLANGWLYWKVYRLEEVAQAIRSMIYVA